MTAEALTTALREYVDAAIAEHEFRKDEGRGWIKPYPPQARKEAEGRLRERLAELVG